MFSKFLRFIFIVQISYSYDLPGKSEFCDDLLNVSNIGRKINFRNDISGVQQTDCPHLNSETTGIDADDLIELEGFILKGQNEIIYPGYNIMFNVTSFSCIYIEYVNVQETINLTKCFVLENITSDTSLEPFNFECSPWSDLHKTSHILLKISVMGDNVYQKKYWLARTIHYGELDSIKNNKTCHLQPFLIADVTSPEEAKVKVATSCSQSDNFLEYSICCNEKCLVYEDKHPTSPDLHVTCNNTQDCASNGACQFNVTRKQTTKKLFCPGEINLNLEIINSTTMKLYGFISDEHCNLINYYEVCCGHVCVHISVSEKLNRSCYTNLLFVNFYNRRKIPEKIGWINFSLNETYYLTYESSNVQEFRVNTTACCGGSCESVNGNSFIRNCKYQVSTAIIVTIVLLIIVILASGLIASVLVFRKRLDQSPKVCFLYCGCDRHKIYWTLVENFIGFLEDECYIRIVNRKKRLNENESLLPDDILVETYDYLCIVPLPSVSDHDDSLLEENKVIRNTSKSTFGNQRFRLRRKQPNILIINLPFCTIDDLPRGLPSSGRNIPSFRLMDDFDLFMRYIHRHNPKWMVSNITDVWLEDMRRKCEENNFTNAGFSVVCDDRIRYTLQNSPNNLNFTYTELVNNDSVWDIDRLEL